ncbi:hypothetical protein DM02DRAFT_185242 [Periconia macrospinosa]|uniref:Uncharacterized protein n=1 Tax=Periconia macrospinosa TaxID=97972 RepID=A0A2V1DAP6_9PLEO|nr:hypothetical protein DM02DRAFT_185242 [Periconia macrospinosa]
MITMGSVRIFTLSKFHVLKRTARAKNKHLSKNKKMYKRYSGGYLYMFSKRACKNGETKHVFTVLRAILQRHDFFSTPLRENNPLNSDLQSPSSHSEDHGQSQSGDVGLGHGASVGGGGGGRGGSGGTGAGARARGAAAGGAGRGRT